MEKEINKIVLKNYDKFLSHITNDLIKIYNIRMSPTSAGSMTSAEYKKMIEGFSKIILSFKK